MIPIVVHILAQLQYQLADTFYLTAVAVAAYTTGTVASLCYLCCRHWMLKRHSWLVIAC